MEELEAKLDGRYEELMKTMMQSTAADNNKTTTTTVIRKSQRHSADTHTDEELQCTVISKPTENVPEKKYLNKYTYYMHFFAQELY